MPDIVIPVGSTNAPRYRYYTADIVTNKVIGELSLEDVNYERSLKNPGSFDGKIPITEQTNTLDLYNATMPGKTAIYAVRDGVCVWGGIIWGRTYDMVARSLTFSASEFTSYLNHRIIWKTYSQSFETVITKQNNKDNKYFLVEILNNTLLTPPSVGDKVRVSFLPNKLRKFTKDYTVVGLDSSPSAPADPGQNSFYVEIPKLPYPTEGHYPKVTVTLKVDTYEYLRDLITNMLSDFEYIQFPNEEITPGIRVPITVATRKLITSSVTKGVATLTTTTPHGLVVGQRIEIANVHPMLDGKYAVAEIPSPTSFTYIIENPTDKYNKSIVRELSDINPAEAVTEQKTPVQYREVTKYIKENITHVKRVNGVVTLQLNSRHRFEIGDKVVVSIESKAPAMFKEGKKEVNSFDYIKYNNIVTITDITSETITFQDPAPDHANASYNISSFSSVEIPANNTVQLADSRVLLKVYPAGGNHGYNIGEQVQIIDVDGYTTPWTNPIFDGYSEIYEVSPGILHTIVDYKIEVDANDDNLLKTDDTYVYLYFSSDPKFKAKDKILVAGLTTDVSSSDISFLNGIHTIEEDSKLLSGQYYIYFRFNWDAVAKKGAGSGGTASVNGKSWIAYEPAYSEIKYDVTLKEPDSVSNFSSIKYVPAAGATDNRLTVVTTSRHNLVVGDFVSVNFSKQEDKNLYGADYVEVISVADLNTFTYVVPKNSKSTTKDPIPPKKGTNGFVEKTGVVTRVKSAVGAPQPVQVSFTDVYSTSSSAGGAVSVYSPNHGLSVGDSVVVDVDGLDSYALENNKEPVKIKTVTQDVFSYETSNEIPATDDMEIRGIGFTTDSGKKVITFDIVEKISGSRAQSTGTITKVRPKYLKSGVNNNYVTYTLSSVSPRAIVVGEKVTISGLTKEGTNSISTTTATVSLSNFNYVGKTLTDKYQQRMGNYTLVFTFSSGHGLPIGSGYDDDDAPATKNTLIFSGLGKYSINRFNAAGLFTVDLSFLNGKTVNVKSVITATSLSVSVNLGEFGFISEGAISGPTAVVSNKNKVSTTYYDFEQFNGSGKVDYVSPSGLVFAVKYDFLSKTEGNAVNPSGAAGTEYTLGTTGSAKFAAKNLTNITAGSVINVSGLANVGSSDKKTYSKVNGIYEVLKVTNNATPYNKNSDGTTASPSLSSNKVFVINKLKTDDGKATLSLDNYPTSFDANYTDAGYPGLKHAELQKWQSLSGTAYVDLSQTARDTYAITNVSRTSAAPTVAVITCPDHGFEVGDYVEVNVIGKFASPFNQGGLPREITSVTEDTFSYTITAPTKTSHFSIKDKVVTLYFSGKSPHNYVKDDQISVSGINATVNGTRTITSVGPYTISFSLNTADVKKTAKVGTISLTTAATFTAAYKGYAVPGAYIKRVPTVFSRTFGEFPANAKLGDLSDFSYSSDQPSGNSIQNTPISGSSLNTVASILDKYSSGIGGFEYRIDCKLEYEASGDKKFTKTFVLVPIYPTAMTQYLATLPGGKLAPGQWAPPAAFGADKVVFEYPGNITNVNMTESAQSSATRMFVSASGANSGAAEVKYSAASDTTLLAAGWPLLDKKETVSYPQPNTETNKNVDKYGNYDIETDFHTSAVRFLKDSKPPQGDITISVNGSITPVVGQYNPGDWCSIIIDDDFIKNRLNSPLEPRKDVIIRKIDGIKVSVPNNPAFPEMIDLTLVPDWQVDTVGE